MKKQHHLIYISTLLVIVLATVIWLSVDGYDYYQTSLTERFYHEQHDLFKASGIVGHGLGIIGTVLILVGVFGYMARKRYRSLSRLGLLKHWLEFHIFLCAEGAILILFHTSFKFGGIVSISFWSMVAVVISGIIGRFIYIQIPRTIEGRALSLQEAIALRMDADSLSTANPELPENVRNEINALLDTNTPTGSGFKGSVFSGYIDGLKRKSAIRKLLRTTELGRKSKMAIFSKLRNEMHLNRKIRRLEYMQRLFKYWHVAHLPFALIMLVIAIIHIGVTLLFGYKWIF
jgi:hypothetical protein